jgi:hypothetical protein
MISSPENSAVNWETEADETGIPQCEGNQSDSMVSNEEGVCRSTRQLQDLLTNAISALRTDIVAIIEKNKSEIQIEFSKLYSKLQIATENITTKIQQESEKLKQNLHNEVKKLSNDFCTLRNDTEIKFQEVTKTIEGVTDALNEGINAHVVTTINMTDRISEEMNAGAVHLLDNFKEYRTESENGLKEFRQDYSQFREQMNVEQATWQIKAGGETNKVKDSVRLVENRVTEIQAAAQDSMQKVNTEFAYLREELAARQSADSAIPSQVRPVTAVDVANSSQSFSELAASAGNYHMGNCNTNDCTTSVCGNATPQPNANNNSGPTVVNVVSDVFATIPLQMNSLCPIVMTARIK